MKLISLYFCLLLGIVQSAYAQSLDDSHIIVYREASPNNNRIYNLYINDSLVSKLKQKTFLEYPCKPGDYKIAISLTSKLKVSPRTEKGKYYYYLFRTKLVNDDMIKEFIPMDSATAVAAIKKMGLTPALTVVEHKKETQIKTENEKLKFISMPKNRIGAALVLGTGVTSTVIGKTTNGDDVQFSFGGGAGFTLQYGRAVHRYFDISCNFSHVVSNSRPEVQRGGVKVIRNVFSVTPSFCIPIKGSVNGSIRNLRIGGGYDYYLTTTMKFGGLINGIMNYDTFLYNETSGGHMSLMYENCIKSILSTTIGVTYYNVQYDYKSSHYLVPLKKEFSNPEGSGLQLVMGMAVHF